MVGQRHRGNRKPYADIILWQFGKGKDGNKGKAMIILITGASHTGKTLLSDSHQHRDLLGLADSVGTDSTYIPFIRLLR